MRIKEIRKWGTWAKLLKLAQHVWTFGCVFLLIRELLWQKALTLGYKLAFSLSSLGLMQHSPGCHSGRKQAITYLGSTAWAFLNHGLSLPLMIAQTSSQREQSQALKLVLLLFKDTSQLSSGSWVFSNTLTLVGTAICSYKYWCLLYIHDSHLGLSASPS